MPGTVLLLAAAPLGRGRLVDAAGVLPVLAAVAPAVLSGTGTANIVELADPLEPQAVLTRLRAAAATPGPLTVYVTGQLHLDRRQRLPHLALARTTPATVRYTALPWHWIREELRLRSATDTALLVDLHADTETWHHLAGRPLDTGRTAAVYGRITPAHGRRTGAPAEPSYMRAVATLLRSGHRPPLPDLHEQALARVEGAGGDLLLSGTGGGPGRTRTGAPPAAAVRRAPAEPHPTPSVPGPSAAPLPVPGPAVSVPVSPVLPPMPTVPPPGSGVRDPHEVISAAVRHGRYAEADALAAGHERQAAHARGAASDEALHWAEVRADLAMFAGDAVGSCRAWLRVAGTRLAAGQPPASPAVEAAADRAHHQWSRVHDPALTRELGSELAELRRWVPGSRQGALADIHRALSQLTAP
ncbi:hypothetical protein KUM39_16800 [Streptomyces sp. J2-1]|uniref:hypothetical protein n=1 Tax=Streptomyces corallincola TaxID=2851888 RepID=UPI001C391C15|nr:hypothetical protein [Streptomyces corallincola]MBV2356013.1 hypothetical protein [Streptomyces corallincola]